MSSALIAKMQEIVDAYKASGILTEASQAEERVRFFSKNGPKLAKISDLGFEANQFIHDAPRTFANGTLSPPISKAKTAAIYLLFAKIDKDLLGDPHGSASQKVQHQKWQAFWQKQLQEFPALTGQLTRVQQEILAAYRFKTISLTIFKPKGAESTQQDETRAQDFLQEVNNRMRSSMSSYDKRFASDAETRVSHLPGIPKTEISSPQHKNNR